MRFFSTGSKRTSTFGPWDWSTAQSSAIERTRYVDRELGNKRCCNLVRLAQCAGRPENEASEPHLSDIGVPFMGFLLKNTYHFLQEYSLGGLKLSFEDCLSFADVAAEIWSLQKMGGSQRTNRVRRTLGSSRNHAVTNGGGSRLDRVPRAPTEVYNKMDGSQRYHR